MQSVNTPAATAASPSTSPPPDIVERASRYSRYVRQLIAADSDLPRRVEFAQAWDIAHMRSRLGALEQDAQPLGRALRVLRKEVMLGLIARDLSSLADLHEVVRTATVLAEVA